MSRSNLEINGQCLEKRSAAAVTAAVYGIYAGFLGGEHGFFETLQGNTAPEHLKIYAVIPWELPFSLWSRARDDGDSQLPLYRNCCDAV